ncbi:MAG: hypothetical protein HYU88_07290 [Chloroflexi bacterium]|nr:hypothetical protein [Chloroflexota bacterium]MBI4506312.1 hypothetical protein [Chloroflexota bacterium]
MTSEDIARELAAEADLALSVEALARLAAQIGGLRASVAKLAALDLAEREPAVTFTALEDADA